MKTKQGIDIYKHISELLSEVKEIHKMTSWKVHQQNVHEYEGFLIILLTLAASILS
jgi:hypothetical protein